uniref:Aldehyde-alcohol dehydrogenase n=1 Tax=Ethanoligenens harbinense TaxID=253239 RepID=Q2LJY8_9FIRM|nr:alcohol/acetaldehyde dehydrogenase [Ethanoligenens harbinense]
MATETKEVAQEAQKPDVKQMIDELVAKAQKALDEFSTFNQEQVDKIVHAMALAALDKHMYLAKLAVEETGRGIYEDKITKNLYASEYIWHDIKYAKTVGVIDENEMEEYVDIAEPVGIIAGVTPVTNPTSTAIFKSLISVKTRNPIIFGFHPAAQKCCAETARILNEAAVAAGAPENIVQFIPHPSIEATNALMNHPGVATILATGGPGMVKAAYSCGKPALGVGPGNVPCYVEKTAKLRRACHDLILSKTFDNGMICASEQAAIVDKEIAADFEKIMKANGCYFTNPEETAKLGKYVITEKMSVNPPVVGQSAVWIAEQAGIKVPADTKVILAKLDKVDFDVPLAHEKLSPVLGYYIANSTEDAFKAALRMLEIGGLGHSAAIHSTDNDIIMKYGEAMKVGRVLVNSPSSQGGIGDIYNTNIPSLTLGCGSYGHNSVSQNVSAVNLINKKRIAKRRVNMQWFKVPPKIYFEFDAIQYLEKMPNISRAFIVTDPVMVKLGNVDKVLYYLRKRKEYCHSEIFSEVEPDPSFETVMRGVEMMKKFEPDVIIALGGGSSMDAAKGMWLFYEHPDFDFKGAHEKFMDIRKRTYHFPELGQKCQMVAVPTTSGTGSEVTSFAVITDKVNNFKYPLADYALTPNVAIVDPQFVMTMPKSTTADTGLDVLTHAIEAYVSVLANDYTDGLALKAIEIVFKYLPRAYADGAKDGEARMKMHNASCIAGMAFSNAFLGLNHSMAHKLGGEYHIPHGRANAILLPYVVEYNGNPKPTKYAIWPKYETYLAPQRFQEIARHVGLKASTPEEGVASLVQAIRDLMKTVNEPMSIQATGVPENVFLTNLDSLADKAFSDQCTGANPRLPLVSEIAELYKAAYYGK